MEENTLQSQSEIPQTSPASVPNSGWKSKLPLISGVVLLLALVGAAGFLLGKSFSQPKTSSPSSISQVSPSPTPETPTPDPTANWKTILNEQAGISFKYPESLLAYTNPPQVSPDYSFFGFDAFNNKENRDHQALLENDLELEVIVHKPAKGDVKPYLSAIEAADNTIVAQPFPGISGSYTKVKTITDKQTKKAIIYAEPENEYAEYDAIAIDNNNNVAVIRLMTGSYNKREELLTVLDQILSTFKFLD